MHGPRTEIGRPVRVANDANCFAVSVAADGAGAGAAVVFGAILGTGVGGGVVVDGRPLGGANAIAGGMGTTPALAGREWRTALPLRAARLHRTFLSGSAFAADHRRRRQRQRCRDRRAGGCRRRRPSLARRYEGTGARPATVINLLDPDDCARRRMSRSSALRRAAPGAFVFPTGSTLVAAAPRRFERCARRRLVVAGAAGGDRRMSALCRDCGDMAPAPGVRRRCAACGSPRVVVHPELDALAIAHVDCDAFYASIEKRDDPSLRDRPVLVGGRRRGVVMAACYIARQYGVRSAMPMFKALAACPDAVVIPPDMAKYGAVGQRIRTLMRELTPLVEPLSIDEAFLDLGGTERLHHGPPARSLALFALRVEREIGVTVSIGLSGNKFLAKIASDLDKPRGFAVIGRAEAADFLRPRPVGLIWGVGPALQGRLAADGIATIGQLQERTEVALVARYGSIGRRLARFAHGQDDRRVDPAAPLKSLSAETTSTTTSRHRRRWPPNCGRCASGWRRGSNATAAPPGRHAQATADWPIARSRRLSADALADAPSAWRAGLDGSRRTRFRLIGVGA
jgi:DNA polymerase-4